MSARGDNRLGLASILSHLGVMAAVSAVMGLLVAGLAIPFAGVTGVAASNVAESIDHLPADLEAEPLPERTRVLARDGKLLATFYDENRVNVSLEDVSPLMQKAIIAIEDYRFYDHGALDLKGTLRAFITNQANDGVVQGGSSITQQMVKMTLINQAETKEEVAAATADTYERKLNELRYAIAFEEKYSKDWILERYLNIAYFGDGAYGIEAAARHYFSKPAKKLNLRESALLAGLVKNPTAYDPTNDPDAAKRRRDIVLARMAQLNVISDSDAEKVQARGLGLKVTPSRNGCVSSAAPFFCDYARRWLLADKDLGRTVEARQQLLTSGGLTIKTTLDLRFQKAADESTSSSVKATDRAIGGLAMVEPGSGEVRALSQSRPMGRKARDGETFLNYVVDSKYGDSNGFQPGSTFKVFVLASAIADGVSLSTQIASPQQMKIPQNSYRVCGGKPYASNDVWTVNNSTGAGTFNLYTGTQKSVNTFFAQLQQRTGLCKPYRLAKAMGVDLTNPTSEMVPSFTLGAADVSPLEMAGAYATFAGRGLHCENRPVTQILNNKGNVLKDYPKQCNRVMPKDVADAVNDVLRGVQEPGGFGYGAGISLNQPSAGKTGTTSDNKAVWFVGYTPNLATASMIAGANQKGQPMSLNGQSVGGSYVYSAAGSTLAGPQWAKAMQVIQQWLPDKDFSSPDPTTIKGKMVTVPSVYGMSPEEAARVLREAGFLPTVGPMVDSANAYGTVAYLSPGSGTTVGSGSTVTIYVSDGTPAPPPPTRPRDNDRPQRPGGGDNNDTNNDGDNNNGGGNDRPGRGGGGGDRGGD